MSTGFIAATVCRFPSYSVKYFSVWSNPSVPWSSINRGLHSFIWIEMNTIRACSIDVIRQFSFFYNVAAVLYTHESWLNAFLSFFSCWFYIASSYFFNFRMIHVIVSDVLFASVELSSHTANLHQIIDLVVRFLH